ncbi:vanillate demethylase subunit B [Breoghania corrubedonensis]|uniref:Vanillate demethylase subunit B n=1 Tax=Breoghania corrubedonensis TaxID=665038 RepID=A0A2T5VI79_9HYPH|nr:PDR/VanB family oxidoreductase [Breoghania corrubedonensis]PTW63462.1 vanillate demethylase subunit B [Breoghania corrubedonensis]
MRFQLHWEDAVVTRVRDITPTVREFLIAPASGKAQSYAPGSHINVSVLIAGQPDTRSYSLVGTPEPGRYRIAVRRQPESRGGSRYMWSLAEGARITVSNPHNLFALDYDRPQYLLIAGGIGITPLHFMAQTLKRRGADFRLVHAARSRTDLAFADELRETLGEHLEVRTDDDMPLDLAEEIGRLSRDGDLYLCGPMGMLEAARKIWARTGRPAASLRTETFGSSGHAAPQEFTVRIPNLGVEVRVPENRSMLEALEAAGIDMVSDCRRGECGVCKVKVLASDGVIDHRDVFFSAEEQADGEHMCPCVSRVAGGSVTVDTWYRPDEVSEAAE